MEIVKKIKSNNKIKPLRQVNVRLNKRINKIVIKYLDDSNNKLQPNDIIRIFRTGIEYSSVVEDKDNYLFIDYNIKSDILKQVIIIEYIYKRL